MARNMSVHLVHVCVCMGIMSQLREMIKHVKMEAQEDYDDQCKAGVAGKNPCRLRKFKGVSGSLEEDASGSSPYVEQARQKKRRQATGKIQENASGSSPSTSPPRDSVLRARLDFCPRHEDDVESLPDGEPIGDPF